MSKTTRKPVEKAVEDGEQPIELHGADIPRVDAVAGPAHGLPFIVAKALEDQGPEVAELLRKALDPTDDPADTSPEAVGSTVVVKESATLVDAGNGVEAHGEGEDATRAAEAAALALAQGDGGSELVADPGRLNEVVQKADGAEPTVGGPSDVPIPQVPTETVTYTVDAEATDAGSPAWEAEDAANLRRSVALLIELKARLQAASDREWAEYMAPQGDYDDADNSWDLCDVVSTLDWILGCVAKITVEEEADAGQLDAGVMKAAAAVVKTLTRMGIPAGAVTEKKEPAVSDPVVKAAEQTPATPEAGAPAAEATSPADVAKDAVGVYPVTGNGGTNGGPEGEDSFTSAPAGGGTNGGPEDDDSFEKGPDAAASAPHDPTVIKATEEQPAPPAEVDVATAIAKAFAGDQLGSVLKSAVAGALEEKLEPVTKTLEDLAKRVETVEKQPMPGGPMLRGTASRPGPEWLVVKGQEAQPGSGAQVLDAAGVQKAIEQISDPVERDSVGRSLAKAMHPATAGAEPPQS